MRKMVMLGMLLLAVGVVLVVAGVTQITPEKLIVNASAGALNNVTYELTEFNNSLSHELFSPIGVENFTRYLGVPYHATTLVGYLNITGYKDDISLKHLGYNLSDLGNPRDVFVVSDVAYVVSGGNKSLSAFNISDPSSIIKISEINGSGAPNYLDGAKGVYVTNNIAYVASGTDDALVTINVSDSANMVLLDAITGTGSPNYLQGARAVMVVDNIAYVVSNVDDALVAFNVSIPSSISLLDAITGTGSPNYLDRPRGLYVDNNVAYVASYGDDALVAFNVSNSSSITLLNAITGTGSPNYLDGARGVYVSNNVAYVASNEDDAIVSFNVSIPSSISLLDAITGTGSPNYLEGANEIFVDGSMAYVASGTDNALAKFNVSNPSDMQLVSTITGTGSPNYLDGAEGLYKLDDNIYVTSITDNALTAFTNGSYPRQVSVDVGNDGVYEFEQDKSLSTENITIDLSSVLNGYVGDRMVELNNYALTDIEGYTSAGYIVDLVVNGDTAYAITSRNELLSINVSKSDSIDVLDSLSVGGVISEPRIAYFNSKTYHTGYVTFDPSTTDTYMFISNVSEPSEVTKISNSTSGLVTTRGLYVGNRAVYIASNGNDSLVVYNQTTGEFISIITGTGSPNYLNNIEEISVDGDIAYVISSLDNAITTFNVSDLDNIVPINTSTQSLNGPNGLAVDNGIAFVVSQNNKLLISFNVTNTSDIKYLDSITTYYFPRDVAVSGDYAYVNVADVLGGYENDAMLQYNISNPTDIRLQTRINTDGDWTNTENIYVSGGVLYMAGRESLTLFDVSPEPDAVPVVITANGGEVNISDINITFVFNTSYLYERNDVYTWNQTTGIDVNTPYKRRYRIEATDYIIPVDNVTIGGYYLRNWTASECQVNNEFVTVTGNYCEINQTYNKSQYWPTAHIWDNNITDQIAVNWTNASWTASNTWYQNDTLTYRDADTLSTASSSLFTNVTVEYYYDSRVTQGETLEFWDGSQWVDITPDPVTDCVTSPTYTRKTAGDRVFHVCLDTTNKYVSYKVEESN